MWKMINECLSGFYRRLNHFGNDPLSPPTAENLRSSVRDAVKERIMLFSFIGRLFIAWDVSFLSRFQ